MRTLGPAITLALGLIVFVSHRAAVTDPYGFLGQLLDGYYANWHEPVDRRRKMMRVMSWCGLGIALLGAGGVLFSWFAG